MAVKRLTNEEESAWRGFLDTHAKVMRELEARLAPVGIGTNDYGVLVLLEEAGPDCGLRMAAIAERMGMTSGGLTRLADRLEQRGLIERRRCGEDGRGFFAVITPEGVKLLAEARKTHLDDVRELFLSHLSNADMAVLAQVWQRMLAPP